MLPIVQVPETIRNGMQNYRDIFCRDEGFDHVSRYVTGLIISPNKTLLSWNEDQRKGAMICKCGMVRNQVADPCMEQCLSRDGVLMSSSSSIEQWWLQITVARDEKSLVWTGHLLIMIVAQRYMQQKKAMTM